MSKRSFDGTIVVLDFRNESVDLIHFKNEDVHDGDFDSLLMDYGYDLDVIKYMVTNEVKVSKYWCADGGYLGHFKNYRSYY